MELKCHGENNINKFQVHFNISFTRDIDALFTNVLQRLSLSGERDPVQVSLPFSQVMNQEK